MGAPLQILWLMSLVLVMIYEDVFGPNNNEVRIVEQRKSITVAQTKLQYAITLTKPPSHPQFDGATLSMDKLKHA